MKNKRLLVLIVACVGMILLTPTIIADREHNVQKDYEYLSNIAECPTNNFVDEVTEIPFEYEKLAEIAPHEAVEIRESMKPLASLGNFIITYYCACPLCCHKDENHPAYGVTASGAKVEEGVTIAVDPTVIPLGEKVIIDGHQYLATDTGGSIKGNRIDIYMADHNECLQMGVQEKEVWVMPTEYTED